VIGTDVNVRRSFPNSAPPIAVGESLFDARAGLGCLSRDARYLFLHHPPDGGAGHARREREA
jgi:hypothetical protein